MVRCVVAAGMLVARRVGRLQQVAFGVIFVGDLTPLPSGHPRDVARGVVAVLICYKPEGFPEVTPWRTCRMWPWAL